MLLGRQWGLEIKALLSVRPVWSPWALMNLGRRFNSTCIKMFSPYIKGRMQTNALTYIKVSTSNNASDSSPVLNIFNSYFVLWICSCTSIRLIDHVTLVKANLAADWIRKSALCNIIFCLLHYFFTHCAAVFLVFQSQTMAIHLKKKKISQKIWLYGINLYTVQL